MTCGGFYFGRDAVWFRVMRRWLFSSHRARDAQRLPGAEPRLVHTTRCDFWGFFFHYVTSVRGSRGFSGVWDRGERPPRWVFGPQRAPGRSASRTAAAAEPGAETAPKIKLAGWSRPGGVWGVLDFWAQGRVWGDPYPKLDAPKVFCDAVGLDRDLPPGPPPILWGRRCFSAAILGGIAAVSWSSHMSKCKPAQHHLQVLFASESARRAVANDPKASSEPQDSLFSCRLLAASTSAHCHPGHLSASRRSGMGRGTVALAHPQREFRLQVEQEQ